MGLINPPSSTGGESRGLIAPLEARLTLVSGQPVADQAAGGTLYLTPYRGNRVAVYSTTSLKWEVRTLSEISLALSGLTAGKNYDVFLYWTGAALAIELSAAWTNDTTRADAVVLQDGVRVKSTDKTRRLVGTIRASGAATTEDTVTKRFVRNEVHQIPRKVEKYETAVSWNPTTAGSWEALNNSTANRIEALTGPGTWLRLLSSVRASYSTAMGRFSGIGIDSTSSPSGDLAWYSSDGDGGQGLAEQANLWRGDGDLAEGYHYFQALQRGDNASVTFKGEGPVGNMYLAGIAGVIAL